LGSHVPSQVKIKMRASEDRRLNSRGGLKRGRKIGIGRFRSLDGDIFLPFAVDEITNLRYCFRKKGG
jgi:hypothetical protein